QTVKANPLGLLLSVITAVITAVVLFRKRTDELTEAQKISANITEKQKELTEQYTRSVMDERSELNTLVNTIINVNDNNRLRDSLIKKLNEKYPEFLKNLDLEKISNDELLFRLKNVNDEYDRKIRNMALQAKIDANTDASVKSETRKLEIEQELQDLYRESYRLSGKEFDKRKKALDDEYRQLNLNIEGYKKSVDGFVEEQKRLTQSMVETGSSEYYKKQMESLQNAIRIQSERAESAMEQGDEARRKFYREQADMYVKQLEEATKQYENAVNAEIEAQKQLEKSAAGLTEATGSLIQAKKDEIKEAEKLPETTEEEITVKNRRLKQLKDELAALENLGVEKDKGAKAAKKEAKEQTEADRLMLESMKRTHAGQLQLLEEKRNSRLEELQDEETDQKLYALRAAEIESEHASERLEVIKKFGEQVTAAEFENAESRQKAVAESSKEIIDAETALAKSKDRIQRLYLKTSADFERQFRIKTWTQRKEEELALLARYRDRELIDEETYRTAVAAVEKKYADEQFRARREYELDNMRQLYDAEMEALAQQHARQLLTEEEFEQARLKIKLGYAAELVKQQQQYAQHAFDTVKALEESETASLQAEYARREAALMQLYSEGLMATEEYNTQKEQLDYEQRVKELEVQKKYADVNFAMQASQIIATGAVAAIQAFSAMASIPVVGPALGAIAAAAVAVTTALQLAKAKAERDRVKAMTLEAPGGGSDSASKVKTGSIQLQPGFAEGGSNTGDNGDMRGGGYTGRGAKYDVAGWLPVHSGEYVVDAGSLKYPDVADKVRAIERVRRRHTSRNPLPRGFAEGGSNTGDDAGIYTETVTLDARAARQLVDVLTRLAEGDIRVNYGITELEAKQRDKLTAESSFTKK
ncbi:MAG: hypothetical protein LBF85_01990, partial [Tannerella sp.]|nr:hypothetical protein [Tannerella sp.]